MQSIWSTLLPAGAAPASSPTPDASAGVGVASIWSAVPSVDGGSRAEDAQLFHPRYVPGDRKVSRRLRQERVKPLQVDGSYGSAGNLTEHPQQTYELWGDTTRARLPHQPDRYRLRTHNSNGRDLFDITPAQPQPDRRSAAPLYSQREGARFAAPPSEQDALISLRLGNPSTHVAHPNQLMPFATLAASVRPNPLSSAGFRPLVVASVQGKWQRVLGVGPHAAAAESKEKEDADEEQKEPAAQQPVFQNWQPAASAPAHAPRHDMATSPMTSRAPSHDHAPERSSSVALSPMANDTPAAAAPSAFAFPPAPPGINPDEHLLRQAEAVHRYSIRALKEQLVELKREDRALAKEQRASEKQTLANQHQWDRLVGLAPVDEVRQSQELDETGADGGGADAPLRHALALDDEQEQATQTDSYLQLQHPMKPRLGARSKKKQNVQSMEDRIAAEVAEEFKKQSAATFADNTRAPIPITKPATGGLPQFQSHADQYREQLKKQYKLIFDAQLASAKDGEFQAGSLVEARLRKLREDTLRAANPFLHAQHMAALAKQARRSEANEAFNDAAPSDAAQDDANLGMPETVIGSRTAALLFVDPQMMLRRNPPPAVAYPSKPANPATQVPNKVVELTQKAESSLASQLGFAIPQPTFPTHGTTHRPLVFQPVREPDPNAIDIPVTRAVSAWEPEAEVIIRHDANDENNDGEDPSAVDRLNLFAGKPPMVAIKNECAELDIDVARLEATIQSLHREFAAPRAGPEPPGSHALIPSSEKDAGKQASAAKKKRSEKERQEEDHRLAMAQRYVDKMDAVLGLPQQAPILSPRASSSSSRSSGGGSNSARLLRPSTEVQPTNAATSQLVSALEQYLSLDMGTDLFLKGTRRSMHSAPPPSDALSSFSAATHDVHRPDEFTSHALSPSYLKAQAAAAAAAKANAEQQQQHPPHHTHVHHSWGSQRADSVGSDEREQRHVEEMLAENARSTHSRTASRDSPAASSSGKLGHSLSRVSEDHEQSRSLSSAGTARSQHRPVRASEGVPLSGRHSYRSHHSDLESSADDPGLWQDSEDDHSMVMHVPSSYGASRPGSSGGRPSQLSMLSPAGRPRVLSPSAAQQRRSPPPFAQIPSPLAAPPAIQPRTNRSAELRKAQLLPQPPQQHEFLSPPSPKRVRPVSPAAAPAPARKLTAMELERERRRQKQLHGGMIHASHDRMPPAGFGPHPSASPPTQRTAAGNARPSAPPALSASSDRVMREAKAMMADMRQQLDAIALPADSYEDEPQQRTSRSTHASADSDAYQHAHHHPDEYRPDAHRDSWRQHLSGETPSVSHSLQSAAPAPPADDEWYAPPSAPLSWDELDELAETDADRARAQQPPARNPLDDSDDELFS